LAKTGTFSVRAAPEDILRWKEAAGGLRFNDWVKRALNEAADLEQAEERQRAGVVAEREKIVKKSRPQTSGACKHEGYKHLPFCYRCGARP